MLDSGTVKVIVEYMVRWVECVEALQARKQKDHVAETREKLLYEIVKSISREMVTLP